MFQTLGFQRTSKFPQHFCTEGLEETPSWKRCVSLFIREHAQWPCAALSCLSRASGSGGWRGETAACSGTEGVCRSATSLHAAPACAGQPDADWSGQRAGEGRGEEASLTRQQRYFLLSPKHFDIIRPHRATSTPIILTFGPATKWTKSRGGKMCHKHTQGKHLWV